MNKEIIIIQNESFKLLSNASIEDNVCYVLGQCLQKNKKISSEIIKNAVEEYLSVNLDTFKSKYKLNKTWDKALSINTNSLSVIDKIITITFNLNVAYHLRLEGNYIQIIITDLYKYYDKFYFNEIEKLKENENIQCFVAKYSGIIQISDIELRKVDSINDSFYKLIKEFLELQGVNLIEEQFYYEDYPNGMKVLSFIGLHLAKLNFKEIEFISDHEAFCCRITKKEYLNIFPEDLEFANIYDNLLPDTLKRYDIFPCATFNDKEVLKDMKWSRNQKLYEVREYYDDHLIISFHDY